MQDFYAPLQGKPVDQADGLRRMFAGRHTRVLPVVANPHVPRSAVVLDRLAEVLAAAGQQVLVVDAGAAAPPPPELAQVDLAASIEVFSPRVAYLSARGLPPQYVDTRGCAGSFIDALLQAWPQADVVLLHAEVLDLARVLKRRSARPVLLAADDPESLKHAYASCKLLVQRCQLMTYDLLLAASSRSPRAAAIAHSLSGCAEQFLGALLRHSARVDPNARATVAANTELTRLLQAQLRMAPEAVLSTAPGVSAASSPLGPFDESFNGSFNGSFRGPANGQFGGTQGRPSSPRTAQPGEPFMTPTAY